MQVEFLFKVVIGFISSIFFPLCKPRYDTVKVCCYAFYEAAGMYAMCCLLLEVLICGLAGG